MPTPYRIANHPTSRSPSRWRTVGAALALAALAGAAYTWGRARSAERAHPPEGRFVEVEGVRLHYVEHGHGDPLVLLHGNATMGLDFELSGLVELAARRYRVIVFDRPGFGHSERPRGTGAWGPEAQARLIAGALARIDSRPAIVLGHSWGALVALALGLDHPASVRSLVLVSGYYFPTMRVDSLLAALPALPGLGDVYRHAFGSLQFRATWPLAVKAMFAPAPVPDTFRAFPPWMAARPSQLRASAAEGAMMVPAVARLRQRYGELSAPVVAIAGTADRVVTADGQARRLHGVLPGSELRLVEGMGHMLHHLATQRVMDAIDAAALRGVAPTRPAGLLPDLTPTAPPIVPPTAPGASLGAAH